MLRHVAQQAKKEDIKLCNLALLNACFYRTTGRYTPEDSTSHSLL
jgi:hypothetical protein